jgi:NSS family neurotransmitter:Na+ symporter
MARDRWSGKLGIILAVAGSAIGLGNFLRFPVKVAQNGGGAFMVPYFVALLVVGLPLMWIEWTIGRFGGGFGHSTAPGMFHTMWEKNRFIKYFGVIGIFGPTVIFIYYTYIESWVLGYSFLSLLGKYNGCSNQQAMSAFLQGYQGLVKNEYFGSLSVAYTFFLITFLLNILIVCLSISAGIEKVCKYGLPILFIFGFILMYRVLTLGAPDSANPQNNVFNGLKYMWRPDWSTLKDAKVWLAAAGQIFFTLGCGLGAILTYASYLTKNDDVVLSGLEASAANEFAEVVMGGTIVIPAAFAFFGLSNMADVAKGGAFNLGFVTMPLVLQKMAFGNIFGFMWFMLLFIAGITSSLSLALPAIAFLEDEFNLSKKKASLIFAFGSFVLCHFVIFFLGNGVLDEMDFWGGTFCPVVFALVEVILFAWIFGMDRAWTEMHSGSDINLPRIYRFIIKYVTPLFLVFILGFWLIKEGIPVLLLKKVPAGDVPVSAENIPLVILTRVGLVGLFAGLVLLVWLVWRRRARQNLTTSRQSEQV